MGPDGHQGAGCERRTKRERLTPPAEPSGEEALRNANRLKERFPRLAIHILYRDVRTPSRNEILFEQARRRGNALTGRLANTPLQQGWSLGDVVTVPFADVSDWTWRDARGVFQGNRTTRVLLPRLSPEDAAALREQMGWDR